MTAGYSGTPLARKLSLKDGLRTWWENMPEGVRAEIEGDGLALDLLCAPVGPIEAAHVFTTSRAALEDAIRRLLPLLDPAGFLWISWPKRASKVPTDITEDVIREIALPTGLVDVKVCAIDATWSGLKLMIRRERR
jgi:hypothetical protein